MPWNVAPWVPEAGVKRNGGSTAIHRRSIGLRENGHHQVSRLLVRKYAVLAIESLNVAGMDQLASSGQSYP